MPNARQGAAGQAAVLGRRHSGTPELRVLVVIASYGNGNDPYLLRLIEEYASMRSSVHIIVLSNIPRDLGPEVEVLVGLPARDPWSLPFGHKRIMADRLHLYDLFIYSEDDTLITQANIDAFLQASSVLPDDQIAGFLRYETASDGALSYPDVHLGYHWQTDSVTTAGGSTFAYFTNEHAAVFMLTRAQLRKAINSGGFLVAPHKGPYDLLVTAATDPYTQCGFRKMICISELEDFLVPHLPNKYVGKLGVEAGLFERQVHSLLALGAAGERPKPLLTDSADEAPGFEKNYYEPLRSDLIAFVPASAERVLSIGCGWGATEQALARAGKSVVAIPLDAAISACVDPALVRLVHGDIPAALSQLSGEAFGCLLISDLLHRFDDPAAVLRRCAPLLSTEAAVIIAVPNLSRVRLWWRRFQNGGWRGLLPTRSSRGPRPAPEGQLRSWLQQAGMRVEKYVESIPSSSEKLSRRSFGLARRFLANQVTVVAVPDHPPIAALPGKRPT